MAVSRLKGPFIYKNGGERVRLRVPHCPSKFLHQPLSTMGAKHSRPPSPSDGSAPKRASRLDLVKPSKFLSHSKNKGKGSDTSATVVPEDSTKGNNSESERAETDYSTPIYETTGQTTVSRTLCGCANRDKHGTPANLSFTLCSNLLRLFLRVRNNQCRPQSLARFSSCPFESLCCADPPASVSDR